MGWGIGIGEDAAAHEDGIPFCLWREGGGVGVAALDVGGGVVAYHVDFV